MAYMIGLWVFTIYKVCMEEGRSMLQESDVQLHLGLSESRVPQNVSVDHHFLRDIVMKNHYNTHHWGMNQSYSPFSCLK